MKITFSLCENAFDKKVTQQTLSVAKFFECLAKPPDERDAKDGEGICLASFDEAAWWKDPRKPKPKDKGGKGSGWMQDDFVLQSFGYLGDVDNDTRSKYDRVGFSAIRKQLDDLGCAYFLHTTYRHETEHHKLRFYIPFSRPLSGTPRQICAAYKRVHERMKQKVWPDLDSRSSPSFMAYLPATPWTRANLYKSHLVADRPLWKPPRIRLEDDEEPEVQRPRALEFKPLTLKEWKVKHGALRISGPISDLIKHGPDPRPNGKPGDRSAACMSVFKSLHHAGMSNRDIARLVYTEKYLISKWPREKGWDFLCADIPRALGKNQP